MNVFLTRDFQSGLLFLLLGAGTIAISSGYPIGTAAAMGPGYFPILIGGVLSVIGLYGIGRAVAAGARLKRIDRLELRPLFFILASIAAFSLLIDTSGLIVAIAALVAISHFAIPGSTIRNTAVKFVVLTFIAVCIFVFGLGIPLTLIPQ